MNTPFHELGSQRRSRLRTSALWTLAIVFGVAAVASVAGVVHDTSQQRVAGRIVAGAVAEQVATLAAVQLAGVGDELLAGATSSLAGAPFRFDVASGALRTSAPATTHAALVAIARSTAARDVPRTTTRLAFDAALGSRGVVAAVRRDTTGAPSDVVGVLADATAIGGRLFASNDSDTITLARLDSQSVHVATASGLALVGHGVPAHRYDAMVRGRGALEGLTITVALAPRQIPVALLMHVRAGALWWNGVLVLCAVLAIGLAAGSSRREVQLARARSDFVAGVSHDLRMPLAQILLAGETLAMRRERDDGARVTLASSIVREARRLVALVDNVLLFSRSGASDARPRLGPLSVDTLLADVTAAVQLALDDTGQSIATDAPPSLVVRGDRQLVRQALVNLVDNAIKYGAPAQRIALGAARHGATVRLHVDDAGPGIPLADRRRVFDAYERLARDQDSERTGTGLGLAVVRHVAEVCEGRAWVEDAPGGGARVVLELGAA
jgi:signal transduction histidine kinase